MPIPPRRWLAAVLLAWSALAGAQAPGSAAFDRGVEAYSAGDFGSALVAFESARQQGYEDPRLRFNLALTYYQLERYPEARAEFETLRAYPDYLGIADFHLGLVAAREGDHDRARTLWRALEQGPDRALAQRAGVALQRLDESLERPPATAYLLAGGGYDSNPSLIDERLQPAGAGSADAEVFASFTLPLAGTARRSVLLNGGAWLKNYADDTVADQGGLFAGLSFDSEQDGRASSFSFDASTSTLDGADFLRIVGVQLRRGAAAGTPGASFRVQASDISAAAPYGYLEGWRARLDAGYATPAGRGLLRFDYEFEGNDRKDLASGAEFFSHSPLRHRLDFSFERPAAAGSMRLNLRYRDSRYRDPNVVMRGAVLVEERRHESLAQAGLQLRRAIGNELFWLLELQYAINQATPDAYDYDRATALLALEWVPTGE